MVSDKLENLHLYSPLAEGLIRFQEKSPVPLQGKDGYSVDRKHTVLFVVDSFTAVFSTSWRENPDSREPLAAVTVQEGSFVLFLPGEPYLVKAGEASVRMYRVE